jgi:hypothetical protein
VALPPLPCIYCPPDGSPCSRCDDDSATEAAPAATPAQIDLSQLTGIWADVYGRQDALYTRHQRKARTAWRKAVAGLDLAALIAAFRRQALMIDGAPAPGTGHESPSAAKYHKAELRNLARSMASGFLMGVNDEPDYAGLLAAVTAALTAAAGEGTAAALAVSAAGAGYTGFAWAKASRDGQQEPDNDTVTGWAAKIIAGAVTDLASALAAGAIAGASAEAMLAAASAMLSKGRSVVAFLGQAMQSAISAAVNAAYAALGGIESLDWVTAGSGNVCAICQGYADKSPYTPRNYPAAPHPGCRCVPQPSGGLTLPFGAFAAYLIKRAA